MNAKNIISNMYELTQAEKISDTETGKEISIQDLQHLFYQELENLAEVLGIELEEA